MLASTPPGVSRRPSTSHTEITRDVTRPA